MSELPLRADVPIADRVRILVEEVPDAFWAWVGVPRTTQQYIVVPLKVARAIWRANLDKQAPAE